MVSLGVVYAGGGVAWWPLHFALSWQALSLSLSLSLNMACAVRVGALAANHAHGRGQLDRDRRLQAGLGAHPAMGGRSEARLAKVSTNAAHTSKSAPRTERSHGSTRARRGLRLT